jgi:pyridoxal phosphate enzyme (YggS family)
VNGTVEARLAAVRERIVEAARRAGRDPGAVTLVAVSKTVGPARIAQVADAGQRVFGENRAQELLAHADALDRDLEWHFIGRLQRNKVRAIAHLVARWQSVDRTELVTELAKHAPGARVLVQVNVGDEPQKGGCAPDATPVLVDDARNAGLRVEGLMTVPPEGRDPRPFFAGLRTLSRRLELPELSMGMSGDFEVAIEEGATIVRVGSAVFGPRPTSPNARR